MNIQGRFLSHFLAAATLAGLPMVTQACAAVQTAGVEEPPPPPLPVLPDEECLPPGHHFVFLATDTTIYRQGAKMKVTPTADRSPFGTQALPARCVSDWAVTGPARLSDDAGTLQIDENAPPGEIITVTFRHAEKEIKRSFRVIAADAVVLTGRWSEQGMTGCHATEPVGELEFSPDNRFSVTFRPFESYRDYWGSYTFDPITGAIRFDVADGNFIPPGLDLEGQAELANGRLLLKNLYLGSRMGPPQSDCTYTF